MSGDGVMAGRLEETRSAEPMAFGVHHIGYCVRDLTASTAEFEKLGFVRDGETVPDFARNVQILFMRQGPWRVELVSPLNDRSPVGSFLRKVGDTPYHICYEVADVFATLARLEGEGYRVIEAPASAPALQGRMVSFLYNSAIGLIELVEAEKRAEK